MRRLYRIIYTVLLSAALLTGCSFGGKGIDNTSNDPAKTANNIVIGATVLDLANPYYVQLVNGIKQQAAKKNVEIIIDDPQSDVDKQIAAVEKFIASRVDAIIIAALDQDALEEVLGKAMQQGIKVIAQATKVENCHIYVSFDEWDMGHTIGQSAGKWIRDKLSGQAEVAILNYPRIAQIANREKGIRDGIAEFAPDAKIVAVESASNPVEGREATLKILKEHPKIKVVVGINDGGALGALTAFEQTGKVSSEIFIGGIDATPEALDKIRIGSVYRGTVDINPNYSGNLAVDFAIKLINGKIVPNKYSENAKLVSKINIHNY